MGFSQGGPLERFGQATVIRGFHGCCERLQRDRGLGGSSLDAVQPGDGRPLARIVVLVPFARMALESSIGHKPESIPASLRGYGVFEECRTTNLALFLRLCFRRDLLASAGQLSGFSSEPAGNAYQSDEYRSLDAERAVRTGFRIFDRRPDHRNTEAFHGDDRQIGAP